MLSLGGRNDGRERSLLGFEGRRVGRGGMEENEVEEGEAFPGQDDDLDPDALSYIDKKLQDVLGHFQKEFEGGVSAETLGAKFGGYGSFLPAHQRSPILSHPKSPIKVPIHNVSRSPCSLQSEVGFQTASIPVSTSNTKDNTKSATQLTEKSGKRDTFISTCSMEGIVQHESASKSVNIGDQKSLKVRIKLGPDNVVARNNPEIYSDLGLDVSPSPSLEDSPSGSRELSPESPNSFCESPSTILQVMTCFSIPGGYLLSPLSEALLQSLEKEDNFLKNFKTRMPQKFASEICADSSNISMHAKDASDFIYKKSKCREKGRKLVQANGLSSEKVMTTSMNNEHGSKTPAAKEEHHILGDSGKDGSKMFDIHKEPNKISTIERVHVFDLGKINHLQLIDSMRTDGTDHSEKKMSPKGNTIPKSRIAGKAFEETSGNGLDSKFDIHRKNKSKTQKISHTKKADSDRRSVRKNYTASQEELVKEISAQKTCSTEKLVFKTMQDKGQAFEGERLIKGGQSCGPLVEPNKEIRNALFSVSPKAKKKTSYVKGLHLESNSKISKSNKDLNKVCKTESQRDFMVSAHTKYSENGAHVVGSSRSTEKQKERSEVNNVDSICVPGPGTGTVPTASISDAVPNLDPAPSVPALVLIEDNWVCCDICQKWRLLPYGTNPESLPKKWQCSMQAWLPGLNSCNISQDKTTKAFHELYQCPAPVGDINLTTHLDTAASSITSADTLNLGRKQENDIHHVLLSGKKKHGVMDADLPNVSSLILLPNSSKNLQVSSGKEELNDVGSAIKSKPANTGISADFAAAKHTHKENHKILSSYKIGAADLNDKAGKYSKQLSKRGIDVDGPRTSKKFKKDNSYHSLKVLHSGVDTSDKQDVNGDTDLLANADRNTLQNYSDHSSFKDFKAKSSSSKKREKINSSSKGTHKEFCSASEAEEPVKYDSNDKKRKLKEWQYRQACQEISVSNQQVVGSRPMIKESLFESELRMQKKAKVAKAEGKESCEVIGGGRIEMKGFSSRIALSSNRKHLPDETDNGGVQPTADEQTVHYKEKAMPGQALDCMDGLKRDVIHMHPLAAAASSSSKVSGSQKNKDNLPEARGSPVESVSSSPMRILNTENSSSRRNSSLKDNVSPKRFSDGEFDGYSDQSGTRTKDQASNACLRSSEVYKSVESGVLDSLKESHGFQDTETNCSPGVKAMDGIYLKMGKHDDVIMSTNLDKTNILSGDGNASHLPNKYHLDRSDKSHTFDGDAFCASGQKKSGKSSLHSRDKHRNFNFDSEKGKLKVLGSCTEQKELHAMRTCNSHDAEAEFDHLNSSKKDDLESHSKQHKVHNLRTAIAGVCQNKNTSRENYVEATSHERQNPSGLLISDEINRTVVDVRKGMHLSQKAKDKLEKKVWAPQTTPESIKGTSSEQHPLDAVDNDASKPARTSRKYDVQNGTLPNLLRQPTTSVPGSSSPMKKDGHLSVNAFIKEARDLKHTANRLKSVGSEVESSGIFFESAMKFLHAASLLEPHNADSVRQGELVPSTQMLQMYYDTAKFCEFCAHEYERLKEMLAAALAYKCAEVAYLKVAYYKNPGASKDRLELQVALDAPLPGESPSSSASDVDNLNNHGGLDKAASARAASSPQIASNHAIASRNRPHVMRLLAYTNYLNCAFDASKKSQNALSAASIDLGKKGNDGVCSVKKVLDFNYHNVEGLLRLVRLSMHSIGH